MKKLIAFLIVMSVMTLTFAKDYPVVPKDQKGDTASVAYSGTTGTFKVTTSAYQSYTTAGTATPGLLYGVILASGAVSDYYVIADTGAINPTSPTTWAFGAQANPQFIDLSACPIKFSLGLSAKEVRTSSGSVGTGVTLLYRLKSDN